MEPEKKDNPHNINGGSTDSDSEDPHTIHGGKEANK